LIRFWTILKNEIPRRIHPKKTIKAGECDRIEKINERIAKTL